MRQVVDTMSHAINEIGGNHEYRLSVTHTGSISNSAIFNTMIFDHRLPFSGRETKVGQSRLGQRRYGVATDVEWKKFGADDSSRVAYVVDQLEKEVDFAIVPTKDSKLPSYVHINNFVFEIIDKMLASGRWRPISGPITVSEIEKVIVLMNEGRSANRTTKK